MPRDDDLTRLRHILDAARETIGYVQNIQRAEFDSSRPLHSVVRLQDWQS
jgi:uncharacterized protein with HEPN domain